MDMLGRHWHHTSLAQFISCVLSSIVFVRWWLCNIHGGCALQSQLCSRLHNDLPGPAQPSPQHVSLWLGSRYCFVPGPNGPTLLGGCCDWAAPRSSHNSRCDPGNEPLSIVIYLKQVC